MTDLPVPEERRRPLGVLVVAAVQFVRAALIVTQILDIQLTPDITLFHIADQIPEPPAGTVAFAIARTIAVLIIAASLAFGVGLLTGRRWGWVGAIVLSGTSLAFAIGGWWDGHPAYTSMLINVIAVFYLNQRDVRATFGELQPDDEDDA
jgi:hypothetical protein